MSGGRRRAGRGVAPPTPDAVGGGTTDAEAARPSAAETVAAPADAVLHVASAPFAMQAYAASIVSASECRVRQTLFGFEAQLGAYDQALRDEGGTLYFIPAPELFSAPQSYRHMAELAGVLRAGEAMPRLRHLRFGMARHARVLKHAENCFVLAESHALLSVTPMPHPFATGTVLPAGFARLALYDRRQAPAHSITGLPLPADILPTTYTAQDLHNAIAGGRPPLFGAARDDNEGALLVRSLGEFDATAWSQGSTADGPGAGSLDWRQALTLSRPSRPGAAAPFAFLMIPWNLANPASVVPDLVTKLCRAGNLKRANYRPVLFPYNEDAASGAVIAALAGAVRGNAQNDAAAMRAVFVARLRTLAGAWALPQLFSLAWLDAGDPERLWNLARLRTLGIPSALVAAPNGAGMVRNGTAPPEVQALAPDLAFAAAADERLSMTVSDQFGERLYIVPTLSPRALAALVNRSLAHVAAASRRTPPGACPGRFVIRHIVTPQVRFPAAGPREVQAGEVPADA